MVGRIFGATVEREADKDLREGGSIHGIIQGIWVEIRPVERKLVK